MNTLFEKEIKLSRVIISIVLLAAGFYMLEKVYSPVSFLGLFLAGIIGVVITFGFDGLKKIFSKPNKGSAKVILISVIVCYVLSISLAIFANTVLNQPTSANPIKDAFTGSIANSLSVLFKTIFMLIGEELFVTLPLVIIVIFLVKKAKLSQSRAVIIATVITAILFGAIHLPTYQWNVFQCFVIIGLTRIPFTIATLKTNSMVSGVIAHIIYDWCIFIYIIIEQLK